MPRFAAFVGNAPNLGEAKGMSTNTQFDAVVIGAGPGGYHAAIRLGQLGKKVICVDRDEVGGVCLNWGCIPTKALLHVGEVIRHIEHADAIGLTVAKADVDREGVAKFKTDVVNANVGGVKTLFKANGVEFIRGEASFKSPTEIVVKTRRRRDRYDQGASTSLLRPARRRSTSRRGRATARPSSTPTTPSRSSAFRRSCWSSAAA